MNQSPFILQRISADPELLDLWVDSRFSAPITYADEEEIYPFRFLQDTAFMMPVPKHGLIISA